MTNLVSPLPSNDWESLYNLLQKKKEDEAAKPLDMNAIEKVTKENRGKRFYGMWNCPLDQRMLFLIEKINCTYARLEQKGVKIFEANIESREVQEKRNRYIKKRKLLFKITAEAQKQIEKFNTVSPRLKEGLEELKLRKVALQYSLEAENGGIKTKGFSALEQHDQNVFEQLKALAETWKKNEPLAVNKELDVLEIDQLQKMAQYPEWARLIVDNETYLPEVFNWCLRDFNQVEIIVKCFETRRKIKEAFLSSNIGYTRNIALVKKEDEVIAFREENIKTIEGVKRRILTGAIYYGSFSKFEPEKQERFNILNPDTIVNFPIGKYKMTVAEMFTQLGRKKLDEVNINLCAWGFINCHPVKGIYYPKTNTHRWPEMTKENWTDFCPPGTILTQKELESRYKEKMEDRDFFFKLAASRKSTGLHVLGCHGYWKFYLRMEDGNWRLCDMGYYADHFQQNQCDELKMFCATQRRVFNRGGDQNGYYTMRHHGALPHFPTKKEQKSFLAGIYKEMDTGVFQFSGRNCSFSVQEMTEKHLKEFPKNVFKVPVTKSKAGVSLMDRIFMWTDKQPEWVRRLVITIIHLFFLSFRSIRAKNAQGEYQNFSVYNHFNEQLKTEKVHQISVPANLPHRILNKEFEQEGGEAFWGITDEKIWQYEHRLEK